MTDGPDGVLATYEARINQRDFDLLAPLIAADATFWFNDGSFVGLAAIRAAFERTWGRTDSETYWLDRRAWLVHSADAAACTYRFNWTATVDGKPVAGSGRGTTVLRRGPEGWQIVHEHLSALPPGER